MKRRGVALIKGQPIRHAVQIRKGIEQQILEHIKVSTVANAYVSTSFKEMA